MLTHTRCIWLQPGTTVQQPVEACRACALSGRNPCGLPAAILIKATADRDPEVVQISATMLDGCPREHGIKKHEEWGVDPRRAYTRAYGSVFHEGAEVGVESEKVRQERSDVTTEVRYRRKHILPDGRTAIITAQLDLLFEQPDGAFIIQDYKVVNSTAPTALARKVAHYIPQFSIQRWILAGMGREVSRVDLHFLKQKGPVKFNLYPDGEPFYPELQLMTLEETELYLDERAPALLDALEDAEKLPDVLREPGEWWRCRYCDVSEQCAERYGGVLPAFGGR